MQKKLRSGASTDRNLQSLCQALKSHRTGDLAALDLCAIFLFGSYRGLVRRQKWIVERAKDGEHARSLFSKSSAWSPSGQNHQRSLLKMQTAETYCRLKNQNVQSRACKHALKQVTIGLSCCRAWGPALQACHLLSFVIIQSKAPKWQFFYYLKKVVIAIYVHTCL